MPIYEIRCLDTSGHVRRSQTLFSTNDVAAVREALIHRGRQEIEIWQGPRMISQIKQGDRHIAWPLGSHLGERNA